MKKLTLKEAWDLCVNQQWKWIMWHWRRDKTLRIAPLKSRWLKANGWRVGSVRDNCFFCEYTTTHPKKPFDGCYYCPARKINRAFSCESQLYHYRHNPEAFYKTITGLYAEFLKREAEKSFSSPSGGHGVSPPVVPPKLRGIAK